MGNEFIISPAIDLIAGPKANCPGFDGKGIGSHEAE